MSVELLKKMDWKLFEEFTAEILRTVGYDAETTGLGPDRCIDVIAKSATDSKIAVQCKRYSKQPVKVKEVREFFGSMERQGYRRGIYITTSYFGRTVVEEFSTEKRLELIDGQKILEGIRDLGNTQAAKLSEFVKRPGWDVPTCYICGGKMVKRFPKSDKHWPPFWGCRNFSQDGCKGKIEISRRI